MTSSDNKRQPDYRSINSFLHKNFESLCPQQFFKQAEEISLKQTEISLFRWRQYIIMGSQMVQRDYGLIDGSFHKNFAIQVNNSLNREKVNFETKSNFTDLMPPSHSKHQSHCRIIYVYFHKNFEKLWETV